MTFIYELVLYSVEIYRTCKYELLTSKLSKVIIRQTDTMEIIYHGTSRVVNNTLRLGGGGLAVGGWRLAVVSVVGRINEVNQHRARLVYDG